MTLVQDAGNVAPTIVNKNAAASDNFGQANDNVMQCSYHADAAPPQDFDDGIAGTHQHFYGNGWESNAYAAFPTTTQNQFIPANMEEIAYAENYFAALGQLGALECLAEINSELDEVVTALAELLALFSTEASFMGSSGWTNARTRLWRCAISISSQTLLIHPPC